MRHPSVKRRLSDETYDDEDGIHSKINDDGSVSNYFDKRKLRIAPRSTLQFKVGPPFEVKGTYGEVIDTSTGKVVKFQITPRIDRGFDNIDDEWVGYKRNYFTLVTTFQACEFPLEKFLGSEFQLNLTENYCSYEIDVKYFAVMIKARMEDEMTEINLVQHTAKRDKGPQFAPEMCPLVPSELPQHQTIREASNVRNTTKMKKYDSTFYFHRDQEISKYGPKAVLHTYPKNSIQKVARYERVQFASSINMKKPGQQSRHFSLYVILGAVVEGKVLGVDFQSRRCDRITMNNGEQGVFIHLQEMNTPPLIIRGRSPSNYNSSQRTSIRTLSLPTLSVSVNSKTDENTRIDGVSSKTVPGATTPGLKEIKRKCGRPPKSLQVDQVRRNTTYDENVCVENKIDEGLNKENSGRRIQTIEHIENMLSKKVSPNCARGVLQTLNGVDNIIPPREFQVFKDHQVFTKRHSVNLRDIELRNINVPILKDKPIIDDSDPSSSAIFGLPVRSVSENNQYDIRNYSYDNDQSDNSIGSSKKWRLFGPSSSSDCSSSFNIDEVSIENMSHIENIPENLRLLGTQRQICSSTKDGGLVISTCRTIGDTINYQVNDPDISLEVIRAGGIWKSFEVVHSDHEEGGLIYEELDFV
ncbi:transcription factor [Maudiozyma humilis]|uniref:Transcription factor n=1 Tax=Maudiozyma humilis TaxID=51915 RepID=A0AAV5RUP2_MAUHU|nr:transcription factor [Kazachstania humilis]